MKTIATSFTDSYASSLKTQSLSESFRYYARVDAKTLVETAWLLVAAPLFGYPARKPAKPLAVCEAPLKLGETPSEQLSCKHRYEPPAADPASPNLFLSVLALLLLKLLLGRKTAFPWLEAVWLVRTFLFLFLCKLSGTKLLVSVEELFCVSGTAYFYLVVAFLLTALFSLPVLLAVAFFCSFLYAYFCTKICASWLVELFETGYEREVAEIRNNNFLSRVFLTAVADFAALLFLTRRFS